MQSSTSWTSWMNRHPPTLLDEEFDEESSSAWLDATLDRLFTSLPWYKRLWHWVTRRPIVDDELTEEEEAEVEQEFNKQVAVAECIESALASCVWGNRALEREAPGMKRYYVVGIGIQDRENEGEFWLYVKLQPVDERRTFHLPLHEFLEQCYPLRDLTFTDFHA